MLDSRILANMQFHSRLGRFQRLRYLNLGEGIGNGWLEQEFLGAILI